MVVSEKQTGANFLAQLVTKDNKEEASAASTNAKELQNFSACAAALKYVKTFNEEGKTYYIYEHAAGVQVLSDYLASKGPLTGAGLKKAILQFSQLLAAAQADFALFLDANPSRFLITSTDDVKLFNLAKSYVSGWGEVVRICSSAGIDETLTLKCLVGT